MRAYMVRVVSAERLVTPPLPRERVKSMRRAVRRSGTITRRRARVNGAGGPSLLGATARAGWPKSPSSRRRARKCGGVSALRTRPKERATPPRDVAQHFRVFGVPKRAALCIYMFGQIAAIIPQAASILAMRRAELTGPRTTVLRGTSTTTEVGACGVPRSAR